MEKKKTTYKSQKKSVLFIWFLVVWRTIGNQWNIFYIINLVWLNVHTYRTTISIKIVSMMTFQSVLFRLLCFLFPTCIKHPLVFYVRTDQFCLTFTSGHRYFRVSTQCFQIFYLITNILSDWCRTSFCNQKIQ